MDIVASSVVFPATISRAVVVSSNTQLGMIVLLVTGSTPPFNIVAAHFACNSGAYVSNTKLRRV